MSDEDDIQDALADFQEDVVNGQAWTAAIRILTEEATPPDLRPA